MTHSRGNRKRPRTRTSSPKVADSMPIGALESVKKSVSEEMGAEGGIPSASVKANLCRSERNDVNQAAKVTANLRGKTHPDNPAGIYIDSDEMADGIWHPRAKLSGNPDTWMDKLRTSEGEGAASRVHPTLGDSERGVRPTLQEPDTANTTEATCLEAPVSQRVIEAGSNKMGAASLQGFGVTDDVPSALSDEGEAEKMTDKIWTLLIRDHRCDFQYADLVKMSMVDKGWYKWSTQSMRQLTRLSLHHLTLDERFDPVDTTGFQHMAFQTN
jgi:hypothetical protein